MRRAQFRPLIVELLQDSNLKFNIFTAKTMESIKTVDGVPQVLTIQENPCKSKAILGALDMLLCGDAKSTEDAPDAMIHDAPTIYYEINKRIPVWKGIGWNECKLKTVGSAFFPTGESTRSWFCSILFCVVCSWLYVKKCARAKISGPHLLLDRRGYKDKFEDSCNIKASNNIEVVTLHHIR